MKKLHVTTLRMSKRMLFVMTCLLGMFIQCNASRGRTGLNGRAGWFRKPVAVGIFGGTIPGKEPHLLEFHGAMCDHCEAMEPLMEKLRNTFNLKLKRYLVWENTKAFHYMSILDSETDCKGLPFFYNRRTGKAICGATTWDNFKKWALDGNCETFLPPSSDEEERRTIRKRQRKPRKEVTSGSKSTR